MSGKTQRARPATCPGWCVRVHGEAVGEDDQVHISGALQVRRTLLRLCSTIDVDSGAQDGPYVMIGPDEYTLHEAEVFIAALTQLVDEARDVTAPVVPRMRTAGP